MSKNLEKMAVEIQTFKTYFESKHRNIEVDIRIIKVKERDRVTLEELQELTLSTMYDINPEFSNIKNLQYRTRLRDFMMYLQSFCKIASDLGYGSSQISRFLGRTHASIINNTKAANNYIYSKWAQFILIYDTIKFKTNQNVGIIIENSTRQNISESANDVVRTEEKN